jgi:anti-anti-sigma factor
MVGDHASGVREPHELSAVSPNDPTEGSIAGRGAPPDCANLDIDLHVGVDETVIRLRGEVDLVTAPLLDRALTLTQPNGHQPLVVIDLSAITFLDASFLGAIARHRHPLDIDPIRLRAPSRFVARVLDIVGWDDLIERLDPPTAEAPLDPRTAHG